MVRNRGIIAAARGAVKEAISPMTKLFNPPARTVDDPQNKTFALAAYAALMAGTSEIDTDPSPRRSPFVHHRPRRLRSAPLAQEGKARAVA